MTRKRKNNRQQPFSVFLSVLYFNTVLYFNSSTVQKPFSIVLPSTLSFFIVSASTPPSLLLVLTSTFWFERP